MNLEELSELKNKIDRAKIKLSELKGRKESHLDSLKTEFECTSLKDAQRRLEEMSIEIERDTIDINKSLVSLKENFPELFKITD